MRINLFVLLFVAMMLYLLLGIRDDIIQQKDLVAEKTALITRTKEIIADNNNLARSISTINSSKTIERLARERLNFVKKGEVGFKVCR